ncbi:hypothetical protein BC830DRAFT_588375 [Chytriomyces sp. MP71]|nr:hypothetical protein BC830DRAFT_588375 [Chytriomyces sp. MP71]
MIQVSSIFQQSGWFPVTLLFFIFMIISSLCALFIVEAMQAIPGNRHFSGTVEFGTLINFYFGTIAHWAGQTMLYGALELLAVASIIQSSQTLDNLFVDIFGQTCGVRVGAVSLVGNAMVRDAVHGGAGAGISWICVDAHGDSISPFGNTYMLFTAGYLLVAACVLPMLYFPLAEIVWMQAVTFVLTLVIFLEWIGVSVRTGFDVARVPVLGDAAGYAGLVGVVMLNYAFVQTIPAWVNVRRPDVNIQASIWTSTFLGFVTYILTGLLPALAYTIPVNSNLIYVMTSSGGTVSKVFGYLFSIMVLLMGIPVLLIIVQSNLIQNFKMHRFQSIGLSFVVPWLLAIPFQTGSYLNAVSTWTGLIFVSGANFIVPLIIYLKALWFRKAYNQRRYLTKKQRDLLKIIHGTGGTGGAAAGDTSPTETSVRGRGGSSRSVTMAAAAPETSVDTVVDEITEKGAAGVAAMAVVDRPVLQPAQGVPVFVLQEAEEVDARERGSLLVPSAGGALGVNVLGGMMHASPLPSPLPSPIVADGLMSLPSPGTTEGTGDGGFLVVPGLMLPPGAASSRARTPVSDASSFGGASVSGVGDGLLSVTVPMPRKKVSLVVPGEDGPPSGSSMMSFQGESAGSALSSFRGGGDGGASILLSRSEDMMERYSVADSFMVPQTRQNSLFSTFHGLSRSHPTGGDSTVSLRMPDLPVDFQDLDVDQEGYLLEDVPDPDFEDEFEEEDEAEDYDVQDPSHEGQTEVDNVSQTEVAPTTCQRQTTRQGSLVHWLWSKGTQADLIPARRYPTHGSAWESTPELLAQPTKRGSIWSSFKNLRASPSRSLDSTGAPGVVGIQSGKEVTDYSKRAPVPPGLGHVPQNSHLSNGTVVNEENSPVQNGFSDDEILIPRLMISTATIRTAASPTSINGNGANEVIMTAPVCESPVSERSSCNASNSGESSSNQTEPLASGTQIHSPYSGCMLNTSTVRHANLQPPAASSLFAQQHELRNARLNPLLSESGFLMTVTQSTPLNRLEVASPVPALILSSQSGDPSIPPALSLTATIEPSLIKQDEGTVADKNVGNLLVPESTGGPSLLSPIRRGSGMSVQFSVAGGDSNGFLVSDASGSEYGSSLKGNGDDAWWRNKNATPDAAESFPAASRLPHSRRKQSRSKSPTSFDDRAFFRVNQRYMTMTSIAAQDLHERAMAVHLATQAKKRRAEGQQALQRRKSSGANSTSFAGLEGGAPDGSHDAGEPVRRRGKHQKVRPLKAFRSIPKWFPVSPKLLAIVCLVLTVVTAIANLIYSLVSG